MSGGKHSGSELCVWDARNGRRVASRIETASSAISRLVGLLGRDSLPPDTALLITGCRQVHTFFMRFPIDVIAIDSGGLVVGIAHRLEPFRVSAYWRSASRVLECPAGTASDLDVRIGDTLELRSEGGECPEG